MYIYKVEVGFGFKYVEDKSQRINSGNGEYNVAAGNVEEAIEKVKMNLWKGIDGIDKPEDVIIDAKIYNVVKVNYVDII